MKPLIVGFLITLSAACAILAQDSAVHRTVAVRGQVVDARDNVPLRRARVLISADAYRSDAVFTDDDGRFVVANVPAAPVRVAIAKAGFAARLVMLAPDGADTGRPIALERSAAVMGRVADTHGAPVPGVYVTARLVSPIADATSASAQSFTRTDRLGEYRLGSLPHGRYDIAGVRIRPELQSPGTPVDELLFGPADSLDLAAGALTTVLAPGDEIQGVDFIIGASADACPSGPSRRPAPGVASASIAGRVMDASGQPLECAIIRILSSGQAVPQTYTDRHGWYSIEGLPAGSFVLEARRLNHVTLQYGQQRPSDPEVPITLREGEQRGRADIILPRGSIISGTVVDEHGEPVQGALVSAFPPRPFGDMPVGATSVLPTQTDDRGQYRLFGVDPGTYVVSASASGAISAEHVGSGRGYAPVHHPATLDASLAQPVAVDVGRDAHGIDIVVAPTLMATVRGTVVDAAGTPFTGSVRLAVSARSGAPALQARTVQTDDHGAFEIRNVSPGEYAVRAPATAGGIPPHYGMQYVRIVDADPPSVTIVMSRGATVEGTVIIDGAPGLEVSGIAVSAVAVDRDFAAGGVFTPPASGSREDGRFRLEQVRGPSRLLIGAVSGCETCYVTSIRVSGVDMTDTPFDFGLAGGSHRDAEIVVSASGATVEGQASDAGGSPVAAYSVLVFSTDRNLWFATSRFTRLVRAGQDGRFSVRGLPPGEYFVAAVSSAHRVLTGDRESPAMLEPISQGAQRLRVAERDRVSLNLRLLRR